MDSDVDIGQQLGSYDLMKRLGHGGFADVYLGEHIILDGKRAAIKVLHTALAEQDKEAFRKEARRLVKLSHPHIVPIIDFALQESTGIPFLVMEYAENGSLHKRHERGEPLDRATIRCYMEQVAPALQYIHEQGLIHRDIKPANMLLGPNDTVWLSDVGIAVELATCTLTPSGTPAYMAPEQFEGKPCPASDQYALGVVVYEWLCGERPFKGSGEELEAQHKHTPPPPLRGRISNLPQEAALLVEAVVLRALAKKPEERFANVTEFADALRQALYPPPPILSEPLLIPSELSPILSEPLSIPSELSPTLSEPLSIPSELSPTLSEPPSIPSELSPTLSEPPSIPSELSPILSEPLLIPSEPLLVQPVAPATQTEPVASPPVWSQRKRSLALICGVLLVLVLVQSAYYLISYRPYVEVTCNPAGFLEVQSVLFLSPLRAVKAPDGHCVGVSDGRFAFDMKRPDAQIKSEAAEAFRQGNIKQAELKWQ